MKRYRSYIERAELLMAHLDQINANLKTQESGIQHAADMYLIPPLMLEVCLQTIRDLGLNPIVCRGEADGHVVQLADKYQGYVVSKDSDMHVYPRIGKGYIPLNTLSIFSQINEEEIHSNSNSNNDITISYSTVKATVYHPQRLASLLKLENVELLPLLGAILGNDYLDPQLVRYPIMEWCSSQNMPVKNKLGYWPKCVAEYLRETCALDEKENNLPDLVAVADNLKTVITKTRENNSTAAALDGLGQALITSIYRYDPESALLSGHSCPKVQEEKEEEQQHTLPESISELGKMSRSIIDCLVTRTFWATLFIEDFQKESSWIISRSLRQCLYTLLLSNNTKHDEQIVPSSGQLPPPQVKEYIREKHHIADMDIPGLPIKDILDYASSNSIQHILNDAQASDQLLYHMHYSNDKKVQDLLTALDNHYLQSFVLCLRYLIGESAHQGTPLKNYDVVGLLVGMMMASSSSVLLPSSVCTDTHQKNNEKKGPNNNSMKKWSEHNRDGNTRPALKKQVLHLTAQYQSVVFCSHLLSQVLHCNTPQHLRGKASLEHMYNGVNMHHYLQLARRGANIGSLLGGPSRAHELGGLFWKLHRATTLGLTDKMEQIYDYRIPSTHVNSNASSTQEDWLQPRNIKKRSNSHNNSNEASFGKNTKRLATTKNKKASSSSNHNKKGGNNIFDVLSFGCNFDDDDE
ncbi:hypothetical protein BDA99DRAFT_202223 [Phascolomyces articulosus]|uniref:Asteroid domain-containing protein n=1 Tax=Phascolomyces articulosus TaxID=60185 RepID=A0AAD5P9W0_9FUNG|nr:hypothetical protein BDA99DRAFT_202223 [Phascolomyces articulosus]